MLNEGDIIICIDNEYRENNLTIDKSYKIIRLLPMATPNNTINYFSYIRITDDKGNENEFSIERFLNMKQYRKLKLKKINGSK